VILFFGRTIAEWGMRSNLFWLSDEQWEKIRPLLPTDVRGKERVVG
jgi:hypothetical protein